MKSIVARWALVFGTVAYTVPASANALTAYAHAGKKPHGAAYGASLPALHSNSVRWKPAYVSSSGKLIAGHFTGSKVKLPKPSKGF